MSNTEIKSFYEKERKEKKVILLGFDDEKITKVVSKLLSPIATIIEVDNFNVTLKYEEIVSYKKEKVDIVFCGVLMEGIDGFIVTKDIKQMNKKQRFCTFTKKGENDLYKTMFKNTNNIELPINIEKFIEICKEMDI
jgi:response regulator RpfG family c-di-GMP phosphodiesterase